MILVELHRVRILVIHHSVSRLALSDTFVNPDCIHQLIVMQQSWTPIAKSVLRCAASKVRASKPVDLEWQKQE